MEGTEAKKVTFQSQSYALIMKNITLLFRNKCGLFCQLLPLIVIILCGIVVLIVSQDREQTKLPYIVYNNPENECFFRGWKMFNPPIAWYSGQNYGTQQNAVCGASPERMVDHIPRMKNDTGCYPSYKCWEEGTEKMISHIKDIQTEFDNHPFDKTPTLPENAVVFDRVELNDMKKKHMGLTAMYSIYIWSQTQFKYCTTYAMQWWSNLLINVDKMKDKLVRGYAGTPPAKMYTVMYDTLCFQIFAPIVFSLSMPQWLYIVVDDKENRIREMMKMLGMKMTPYWVTHTVYFFFLYFCQFMITYALGWAFGVTFITEVNFGLLFGIFMGYGLTQVCFIPFLNAIFNDSALASTILTVFMGIAVIIGQFLGTTKAYKGEIYCVFPPFAFVQGIERITSDLLIFKTVSYRKAYWPVFVSLYVWPVVLLVIGIYCDLVFPRKYGTPESPLFFLNFFNSKRNEIKDVKIKNPKSTDEDVLKEYHKFQKHQYNKDSALVINGLTKTFNVNGNTQTAVNQLCLEIGNETFGLLGQNGAGKTTTINMLTGLLSPNGGSASVCGYNIEKSMEDVHSIIGVCPQFDVLWPDLTTYEIILFYCRLKGHFMNSPEVAKGILKEVGLWSERHPKPQNRLSSQLSGGMRRRLSIAIAMTGNPKVVFLDEPTTGLDVAIRRDVWDLILKIQQNRCIVITTHSMEEADVLCDRVGIMSDGDLVALGTCQRIRNHYAPGYYLKIASEETNLVIQFIQQLLGDDVEVNINRGICEAMIPPNRRNLSSIFAAILKYKDELQIEDWEIQQKGLEDAFIEIITADRKSRGKL